MSRRLSGQAGSGMMHGMLTLLTNDDGIYAPGLAALEREMRKLGEVVVVAPATEQSGVGHSITYLAPLIVKEIFRNEGGEGDDRSWGWAVEGSPADCVKLGIQQFCPRTPDLVLSGINSGLNAGINVLYSGTVAAAIEGAFFGITSVACSLEFHEHARYDKAARLVREIVAQILEKKDDRPQLYNLNIPTAALDGNPQVCAVPMNVTRYGDSYQRRADPWGRSYFWLTGGPPRTVPEHETDLSALAKGHITITPLDYDLTRQAVLEEMRRWDFQIPKDTIPSGAEAAEPSASAAPALRTQPRK
jgi:5'-nucleotidase